MADAVESAAPQIASTFEARDRSADEWVGLAGHRDAELTRLSLSWGSARDAVLRERLAGEPDLAERMLLRRNVSDGQIRDIDRYVRDAWDAASEADRERVRGMLLEDLASDQLRRRTLSIRLATDLPDLGLVDLVLRSLRKDVSSQELRLLAAHPDEFRRAACRFLDREHSDQAFAVLDGLGNQTAGWAAETILSRLEELLGPPEPEFVWETLEELGDPRAIAPLAAEWRPGEKGCARVIDFLARVAGREGELSEAIRREAEEAHRLAREFEDCIRRWGTTRRSSICRGSGHSISGGSLIARRVCWNSSWSRIGIRRQSMARNRRIVSNEPRYRNGSTWSAVKTYPAERRSGGAERSIVSSPRWKRPRRRQRSR